MCGRLVYTLNPKGYATYLDLSVPENKHNYELRPTDKLDDSDKARKARGAWLGGWWSTKLSLVGR
jgi:hypothetical protein